MPPGSQKNSSGSKADPPSRCAYSVVLKSLSLGVTFAFFTAAQQTFRPPLAKAVDGFMDSARGHTQRVFPDG